MARIADPNSLDPATADATEDLILVALVFQPLVDLDANARLILRAASRTSLSNDGRIFRAELRPDLRFSNGRRVVAEDYVHSLERIADPATASWQQAYLSHVVGFREFVDGRTNHLAGLRAPTSDRLEIHLSQPDPLLPYVLAGLPAVPAEATSELKTRFRSAPVGNGPYRLRSWKRGIGLTFERNPYWNESPDRRFERIEVSVGGDETTHLMQFERGELDVANIIGSGLPLPDMARLRRHPHWGPRIETGSTLAVVYIALNTEMPPLDRPAVRQALNYAIDKPRRLFAATGRNTTADGLLPPAMPGRKAGHEPYPYSPDLARRRLAESGVALPLHLNLWLQNDHLTRMICQGVQEDLRQIGVEIELHEVSNAQKWELAGQPGRCEMVQGFWGCLPDPSDLFGPLLDGRRRKASDNLNVAYFQHAGVNAFLDQAAAELDPNRRLELFRKAEDLVIQEAPWIFLGFRNNLALRQPWIQGPLLDAINFCRLDRLWMSENRE